MFGITENAMQPGHFGAGLCKVETLDRLYQGRQ